MNGAAKSKKMPKIKVNDIHLCYEIAGKGDPLVLIAGYTCNRGVFEGIKDELAKHFTLILFDNRGAGESDAPDSPYTVEQMADDTMALIDHLHLNKPHILGHSMGGTIAQTLGYKHGGKIGKIVLANTLVQMHPVNALCLKFFFTLRKMNVQVEVIIEGIAPWVFSNEYLKKRENVQKYIQSILEDPHPQSLIGQERQLEALLKFDSSNWLSKIQNQTLIIYGGEDILCPPPDNLKMAKLIPHAKSLCDPHMGHMTLIEKGPEFCRNVTNFLKQAS